eukprot:gene802-4742_t
MLDHGHVTMTMVGGCRWGVGKIAGRGNRPDTGGQSQRRRDGQVYKGGRSYIFKYGTKMDMEGTYSYALSTQYGGVGVTCTLVPALLTTDVTLEWNVVFGNLEAFVDMSELYGYGFCHVPTSPGEHRIECVTWRPTGNLAEQARSYFVGGGAQVLSLDVVHTASERSFLRTQAMGTVILELGIITRNFEKFGVEM